MFCVEVERREEIYECMQEYSSEKRVVIAQNFQCKRNLEERIKFLNGMSL